MLLGENLLFFVPVSGGMAYATSAGNRAHNDMASHTRRLDSSNLQFVVRKLCALYATATVFRVW